METLDYDFDLTILGGGLAGLSLAMQLRKSQPEARILVLEKQPHPLPEAAIKVGESTVEIGAWYFNEVLGLREHIRESHLPKLGLRFFFGGENPTSLQDGLELGVSKPFTVQSSQLDRGRLENFMGDEARRRGICFYSSCRVGEIQLHKQGHRIACHLDGEDRQIISRWVVDASGRSGLLKRKLGLQEEVDHNINSVWFRINHSIRVDDWEDWSNREGSSISRWLSTNHLMGRGYWVWLIPLGSGSTSVGIVADPRLHPLSEMKSFDRALDWLARNQPQCARAVAVHRDKLMDFRILKHFTHASRQLFSGDRWAITGEAGLFLDPFYSPGSDFIAISNSLICSMIDRDLMGRPVEAMAQTYESIYRNLFNKTLPVYRDQYPAFGNPYVMTIKIMWDYAVYWSFPALTVLQGQLTNIRSLSILEECLFQIGALNDSVQKFFNAWDQYSLDLPPVRAFINQNDVTWLADLNTRLVEQLDDDAFCARVRSNVSDLFQVAAYVVKRAVEQYPQLTDYQPENLPEETHEGLACLFDMLEAGSFSH